MLKIRGIIQAFLQNIRDYLSPIEKKLMDF